MIKMRNFTNLRKELQVSFVNETSIDAGGISREFFQSLSAEILDPK